MPLRIVWSTDWHVADIGPENRIDDYTETCFKKIEQVRTVCEKTEATACVIGGDVFHVKISSKVRHALVARLVETLKTFPCPVHSIIGNHDVSHNNISTVDEKPIGVLFKSGALLLLDDVVFQKDDISVRMVGHHIDSKVELNTFDSLQKGDEDWLTVAYHGYASLNGVSYPGETTFRYDELAKLPVDDWFFGHWHVDQGVQEIDDKNFVNIGSMTRGALTLENLSRTPKLVVATYGKQKRRLQQVKFLVEPAQAVFDLRKKERLDREQTLINEFIEALRQETQGSKENEDVIQRQLGLYGLDKKVKECVVGLLEEAEQELNQARAGT